MKHWVCGVALLGGLSAVASAVELNGELEWAERVVLGTPASGIVTQVNVQPGDAVEAGQQLLQLDTRVAQAQLRAARSAVRKLAQQRAEAQREWDRAKALYERTVLSEHELQIAEIGFANADAEYEHAQAALVAAEVALEVHSLQAPFAARVLAVHTAPGQAVVNAQQVQPLVTVAERGKLRARAAVNAAQAAALSAEGAASVRLDDQRFDARIVQIGSEPLGAERPALYSVAVEFDVPNDSRLRAGQAAILVLP